MPNYEIRPCTLRAANAFVKQYHRHNKPSRGHKFSIGLISDEKVDWVGVAIAGRPVSRHLDDGLTLEVNRTCIDGTRNANSMRYGAVRRAAFAMGYRRLITYTRADESSDSLRGAGFVRSKELAARKGWADSSVSSKVKRDPRGDGGVARILWVIHRGA